MSLVDTVPTISTDERIKQLFDEHGAHLNRFVLGLTSGETHTAEDVVQETMVRAWRHLDGLPTDREGGRRWLFTVARRLVIDHIRKLQSRPREVSGTFAEHVPDGEDTAGTAIANFALIQAFGDLRPVHKTVLTEVYLRHRSAEEIAEDLQIPVGTVRSRIHYALRALHAALAA